jgi:transposase-like protein
VDTSAAENNSTDSLGRRTGPRRQHTIEEKLRIVKETHVKGASVATVARRHDVNPNQVFAWRQMYRKRLGNSRLLSLLRFSRGRRGLESVYRRRRLPAMW